MLKLITKYSGICTTDYHNELYGYLEDVNKVSLDGLSKTKSWKNKRTGNEEGVSLQAYLVIPFTTRKHFKYAIYKRGT